MSVDANADVVVIGGEPADELVATADVTLRARLFGR
jgi:hypothetical protein